MKFTLPLRKNTVELRTLQFWKPSLLLFWLIFFGSCVSGFPSLNAGEADEPNSLSQYYGFSGVELYKLEGRAFNLATGDFDNDGLTDVLAADNRSSCIRFFKQRQEQEATKTRTGRSVNKLKSDWRFDIRQIPVDKQMAGLVVGDFNGNGRQDIAYVGAPDRLVARYQPEPGKSEWKDKWSVRLPELVPAAWMLAAGDLNGDDRTDLAVLGKNVTYVVYQNDNGKMDAPVSLINTSSQLTLLQIADLDGDGRNDLSYQASEGASRGLCARFQTNDGRLGPELRFDLHQPRSVTLSDVDDQPGAEILTVDSRTGRVAISKLKKADQDTTELPTRLVQYGIGPATGSKGRSIAIGDIDGNNLNDVVVTDPDNAQMLVYRQNGIDGLETAETFPGLLGATDVCVTDVDNDGRAEVIVMSSKESVVAVSRFDNGRLTFPRTVAKPTDGFELAAMEVLHGKQGVQIAVCSKKGSGSKAKVRLELLPVSAEETWASASEPRTLNATVIGTRGVSILPFDFNNDGDEDILMVPNGAGNKGVVLIPAGTDNQEQKAPLTLGTSSAGELFSKADQLFVARESFARKMTVNAEGWDVADQFNAGESRARIKGVAVLDLDNDDIDEVVLVDTGIKRLRVLKASDGLYRPWKEVEIGSLRFSSAHVADLNGDGRDDLVLLGGQQLAVLYAGNSDSSLEELASYEPKRDDAHLADVVAGDVNGDDVVDLAVIDTSIDGIEILNLDSDKGLRAATHFRVFEEKRLVSESNARGTEPREGLIADVTNDGRKDLIVLCHDRLIVYPQDTGEDTTDQAASSN